MSIYSSPEIVINGLVLYLDAANPKSYPGTGTTWTDLTNNYQGTLTNGPVFNTENKGNVIFDGINDGVIFGDILGIQTAFSINVWIKGNATQSNTYGCIIGKGSGGNFGNYGMYGNVNNTYVRFGFVDTGVIQREISNSSYLDLVSSNWVNYCGIYDFSILYLYRNAVLIQQAAHTTTPNLFSANDLSIGTRSSSGTQSNRVAMSMSNASIYNRALTSQEVKQNFIALRGRFGI